tara:strand:+ start:2465 stop:3172 length:708 start_codon:yes stop_codon:yes gene_type:complete
MTNERETGPDAGYRPVVLAGAVTVAALALTIILGANITVIAWGAAAWTVSLAVKSAAAADLANLGGRLSPAMRGVGGGLWSAACELGIAAAVATAMSAAPSPASLAAFGLGAGAAELVFLLAHARTDTVEPHLVETWRREARESVWIRYSFLVERTTALALHAGTRGLIWTSLSTEAIWPAITAFALFSLVDGVAVYGAARQWNWYQRSIHRRYIGFSSAAAAASLVLLALATPD